MRTILTATIFSIIAFSLQPSLPAATAATPPPSHPPRVNLVADVPALAPDGDPLDHVSAFSLQIGPDGNPRPGWFPIGLRPKQPWQAVHAGFNLTQPAVVNRGFKSSPPAPFSTAISESGVSGKQLYETHGLYAYLQIRAATDMGSVRWTNPIGNYGVFPPALRSDGTRVEKSVASLPRFYEGTRRYLLDYTRTAAATIGAAQPGARPLVAWGLDNEWEGGLDYSPEAKAAFAKWLGKNFADIADLNRTWGTRLMRFNDVAASGYTPPTTTEFATRPAEFLAWYRFQAESFTNLAADMADSVHANDPLHRPVIYKSTQQTIDMPFTRRYKTFDHVVFGERARATFGGGLQGANIYGAGDREAYEINYIYNIVRPLAAPSPTDTNDPLAHGVMCPEINNHRGPGHQWAVTYWRALASGLKAANFFTMGYEGAKGDYATFGHFAPDGTPRAKMFYAARWAHMVHRTEAFWRASAPAAALPRVAMLLPRHDVVLAERTDRRVSKWAYPMNHRVMVYSWLREQGYWVDVIPETKLDTAYLRKNYKALILIGAEHLPASSATAITDFVRSGGILLADERAGHFDDLHREKRQLESVLGVKLGRYDNTPASRVTLGPRQGALAGVRATGRMEANLAGASILLSSNDGRPLVTTHSFGRGRAIHIGFMTGDLREDVNQPVHVSTFKASGGNETADTGDESSPECGGAISRWLALLLKDVGVVPAYSARGIRADEAAILRVEQPFADAHGNLAVVITTRGAGGSDATGMPVERIPATTLELPLPGGPWAHAVWGSAEDAGLQFVKIVHLADDRYHVTLPPVETAGVLYLLKKHAPLISIQKIDTPNRAIDGHAARVRPSVPFVVWVQLVNPSPLNLSTGALRFAAPKGWTVQPVKAQPTSVLAPGESAEAIFTVIPPDEKALRTNWLYPLVVRWRPSDSTPDMPDEAIAAANVEVVITP
ncbi:hypothetical protein Ga0100231_019370 [Opitutaceae bacterium TAV4]|nr:hypothetical protein Ga0100231_019370 [Opitutaceae bacterium TAV4]